MLLRSSASILGAQVSRAACVVRSETRKLGRHPLPEGSGRCCRSQDAEVVGALSRAGFRDRESIFHPLSSGVWMQAMSA